jgi:hypothetical protein
VAYVKSLAADEIIDYKRQRFEGAIGKANAVLDTGVTPQRPPDEDQRAVAEIMNEADSPCSQTQALLNNLCIIIICTAFLVTFVWGFSS